MKELLQEELNLIIMLGLGIGVLYRLLTIPRRTTLEFASSADDEDQTPCGCGSHRPPVGPAKHYFTLDEWRDKMSKIMGRRGKRATKLKRLIDAHDRLVGELARMSPEALASELGLEKRALLQSLKDKCAAEETRLAKKLSTKWMLCRSCWHVSRRYIHDESVQNRLCYNRDMEAFKANNTFFALEKAITLTEADRLLPSSNPMEEEE